MILASNVKNLRKPLRKVFGDSKTFIVNSRCTWCLRSLLSNILLRGKINLKPQVLYFYCICINKYIDRWRFVCIILCEQITLYCNKWNQVINELMESNAKEALTK